MSDKLKVFLDFDSTLVDSVDRFVKIANKKYNVNKTKEELGSYSFKNMYPSITQEEIREIFHMDEFFDKELKFLPNAIEVLERYQHGIDFYISTSASGRNLELKKMWITNNIPFVKEVFSSETNNKSNIDMNNSIQVDDVYECLKYTNASIKLLLKSDNNFKWQRHNDSTIYNINTWEELGNIFEFYLKEGII